MIQRILSPIRAETAFVARYVGGRLATGITTTETCHVAEFLQNARHASVCKCLHLTRSSSEEGSYSRLVEFCITQL